MLEAPLTPEAPRPRTTVVFLQEALRTSRRWQSWALRVGFTSFVLGALVVFWGDLDATDVARSGRMGRMMLLGYLAVQLTFVSLLAPMLVASGIVEEREDRTLELLAITRLSPRQIVTGKVLSRLLVLLLLVLGTAPAVALALSLGGVDPWTIGAGLLNTLLVTVLLGLVAAVASLMGMGVLQASMVALLWGVIGFLGVPALYVLAHGGSDEAFVHLSPVVALTADSPAGLLPLLAFAPSTWLLLRFSGPLFALQAVRDAGDDDSVLLSPDFWQLEALRRRAGLAGLAALVLMPICLGAALGSRAGSIPAVAPYEVGRALAWAWSSLLLFAGTALYVLVWTGVVGQARSWSRIRVGGLLPRLPRARVWGDPVAWREIATRGQGGVLSRWAVPVWFCGTLFLSLYSIEDAPELFLMTGTFAAVLTTLTFGTESMGAERKSGTLALLAVTTLPSWRIVAGKVLAIAVAAGPFLVVGWGFLFTELGLESLARASPVQCEDPAPLGRSRLGHLALSSAWVGGTWLLLALASLAAPLVARAPVASRAGVGAAAFAWFLLPVAAEALFGGSWRLVREVWFPVTSRSWPILSCGPSLPLVVGTGLTWVLVAVASVALARLLRRRAL